MSKDKTVEKIPEIQFPHELKARNMGYQYSRYTCVKCHRNMDGDAGEGCPVLLATELREANQRVEAANEILRKATKDHKLDPCCHLCSLRKILDPSYAAISADGQDGEGLSMETKDGKR